MKSFKGLLFLLLPGVMLLLAPGCQKVEEGLTAITWRLNFDLIQTTWDVQFLDAQSGEFIGSLEADRVEATITGADRSHILDLAGKRRDVFYATYGFLSFALHPERQDPDKNTPVSYVIHAHHPDYLPVHFPVLCREPGLHPLQIRMVKRTQTPAHVGIAEAVDYSSVINGRLQDSLELYTPLNQARLVVPEGTRMVAPNASELGGALDVVFGYWEGAHTESVTAMPGGQLGMLSENGSELSQMHSAGFVYLSAIDAYDKAAVFLDGPVELDLLLNTESYNPESDRFISPIDQIPLWHQDPSTGIFTKITDVPLIAFQNKIRARFMVNLTGYFMLGWFSENACGDPLSLSMQTLPEYRLLPYSFQATVHQLVNDQLFLIRTLAIGGAPGEEVLIHDLPADREVVIRFSSYLIGVNGYYRAPDPLLLANACIGTGARADLLPFANSTYREVHPVFIDVAHNNTRYTPEVFPGYYRKKGDLNWHSAFVFGGKAYIVNPEEGVSYELGINFKGEYHQKEVVFGEEEIIEVEIEIE